MKMKVKTLGHRVLVKPDVIEEFSDGGILVNIKGSAEAAREQGATITGEVVQIGETAFTDPGLRLEDGEPWVKVGARVYYAQYAGKKIIDYEDGDTIYQLINDEDVQLEILE